MPDEPRRDVFREPEFEEQIARLIPDVEAADEFMASAEELLSYSPMSGRLVSEQSGWWALPMFPIRDKTVVLYYVFDDSAVTFVAIVALDE